MRKQTKTKKIPGPQPTARRVCVKNKRKMKDPECQSFDHYFRQMSRIFLKTNFALIYICTNSSIFVKMAYFSPHIFPRKYIQNYYISPGSPLNTT
jgi:hypothetical protein